MDEARQELVLVLKQGDLQESCDSMEKFAISNDQEFLEILYNYALNPNIKDRERKIVQLGRKELENKVYSLSVANRMVASFQREAISSRLSKDTSVLYNSLKDYIIKNIPLGTPRVAGINAGYDL